jgi:hypothetical protein
MDVQGLQYIIPPLILFIQRLHEKSQAKKQKAEAALFAVMAAVNETKTYIRLIRGGKRKKKRNRPKEWMIAGLWRNCGDLLEPFDQDLSNRCRIKNLYWRDPSRWSTDDVKQARIGLDRVDKEARYLLKLGIRPRKK